MSKKMRRVGEQRLNRVREQKKGMIVVREEWRAPA
jgi:hypothetical protein